MSVDQDKQKQVLCEQPQQEVHQEQQVSDKQQTKQVKSKNNNKKKKSSEAHHQHQHQHKDQSQTHRSTINNSNNNSVHKSNNSCSRNKNNKNSHTMPHKVQKVICNDSLLATEVEKGATSKSLYGDTYARISNNVNVIHDKIRLRAYEAVLRSVHGKNVLHLGCGMGLYAMLAARHLASHVVAVDSSAIVDAATQVAKDNKLCNITFLHGRLREVLHLLPVHKFDVILCEWMGALLLNEPLLADVLYARDHLLSSRGQICPNKSSLHVAGVSDYGFRLDTEDFWSNVYGFTMDPMKELVNREVETCSIPSSHIVTNTCRVHTVEIDQLTGLTPQESEEYAEANNNATTPTLSNGSKNENDIVHDNPVALEFTPCQVAQVGFEASFTLTATRTATIHYLTFYIDATFTNHVEPGNNFVIGIKPGGENAWTEVSVPLREPLPVMSGEQIIGTLKTFTPVEGKGRRTIVQVQASTEGKVAKISTSGEYVYQYYERKQ